jgi:type II secretion system protein N
MDRKKIIGYFFIGFCFFLFLIYQTFPYTIVKENIAVEIQNVLNKEKIPLKISIKSFTPYWLTGVEFSGVEVSNKFETQGALVLDNVTARMSLLPLFIGNVTFDINIYQKNGYLSSSISFPLFSLISGNMSFGKANLYFNEFSLDSIFNQLLGVLRSLENPELALVLPIISKTTVGGNLNGIIEYREKGPAKINLSLLKGFLNIENNALNIPIQEFSKVILNLNWNGKRILVSKDSGLDSEDIKLGADGYIDTPADPNKPWQLNLLLNIVMTGQIEKDFGFLLPQLLNCPSNSILAGVMKINLMGDSNNLSCQ